MWPAPAPAPAPARAGRFHFSGFTLIELMIIVTILGVITVVAVPALNQMVKRHRLISESTNLVTLAQFARSEAMARKKRVILAAYGDGASQRFSQWIVFIPKDNAAITATTSPDADTILREMYLHPTIQVLMDNTTATNRRIQFLPDGTMEAVVGNGINISATNTRAEVLLCIDSLSTENTVAIRFDRRQVRTARRTVSSCTL